MPSAPLASARVIRPSACAGDSGSYQAVDSPTTTAARRCPAAAARRSSRAWCRARSPPRPTWRAHRYRTSGTPHRPGPPRPSAASPGTRRGTPPRVGEHVGRQRHAGALALDQLANPPHQRGDLVRPPGDVGVLMMRLDVGRARRRIREVLREPMPVAAWKRARQASEKQPPSSGPRM